MLAPIYKPFRLIHKNMCVYIIYSMKNKKRYIVVLEWYNFDIKILYVNLVI